MKMRLPALVSAELACLTFYMLVEPTFSQEPKRIRYGTTAAVSHLPVLVGRDSGLFAKYGLDVEAIHIRGGPLITMAIMSGNLQFSGAGAESVVAARIEGGDVVLLACPVDTDPVYLIARPEIKDAASLKGKASAVTRLGSTTHFYLRAALRQLGLDADKDMTILQLGAGGEIAAALESGRIAAAALTFRNALPFLQRGWPVLVDLSKSDLVYPPSCVTGSRAFLREQPGLVERFLRFYRFKCSTERLQESFSRKTRSNPESNSEIRSSKCETNRKAKSQLRIPKSQTEPSSPGTLCFLVF